MQTVYATRTEMPGKAIWRFRMQENPSADPPRWGSLQRSRKPPSWWRGASLSPPQEPHPPLSALRASPLVPSFQN